MISNSFLIWLILINSSNSFWIFFAEWWHYKLIYLDSWFFRSDSKSVAKLECKEWLSYIDFFILIFFFDHIFLKFIPLAKKPRWRSCRHFSFSWPIFALISLVFIFSFCWLNILFVNAIWTFIAAWVIFNVCLVIIIQSFIFQFWFSVNYASAKIIFAWRMFFLYFWCDLFFIFNQIFRKGIFWLGLLSELLILELNIFHWWKLIDMLVRILLQ